jgi:hypothetical protein
MTHFEERLREQSPEVADDESFKRSFVDHRDRNGSARRDPHGRVRAWERRSPAWR